MIFRTPDQSPADEPDLPVTPESLLATAAEAARARQQAIDLQATADANDVVIGGLVQGNEHNLFLMDNGDYNTAVALGQQARDAREQASQLEIGKADEAGLADSLADALGWQSIVARTREDVIISSEFQGPKNGQSGREVIDMVSQAEGFVTPPVLKDGDLYLQSIAPAQPYGSPPRNDTIYRVPLAQDVEFGLQSDEQPEH